MAFSIFESS